MTTYTKVVDPNNGAGTDYLSLNAWEDGEDGLYSSGDIAIADCKRTGSTKDTTTVSFAGWNAGVTAKVIVNSAYRHEGKRANQRGDGNYIYTHEISNGQPSIGLGNASALLDGLYVNFTRAIGGGPALGITANSTIQNCLVAVAHATANNYGIAATNSNATANVINTVVIGNGAAGGYGFTDTSVSGSFINFLNCTFYNFATGVNSPKTRTKAINTGVFNCATCFSGTFITGTDYNVSSDATAPGTHVATGKTAYTDYFVDPANGNFHLKGSSSTLWGLAGTDLSATFTNDIDYQTRSAWDIGADEYVSVGATATAAQVLAVMAQSGAGTSTAGTAAGAGAQTLVRLAQSGTATQRLIGSGVQALIHVGQSGSGTLLVIASGADILPLLAQSGAGNITTVSKEGSGAQALAHAVQSGIGGHPFLGTGAESLQHVQQAGAGSRTIAGISGAASQALSRIAQSGGAAVSLAGAGAQRLAAMAQAGAGYEAIAAAAASMLGEMQQQASGFLPISAGAASMLAAIEQAGIGEIDSSGVLFVPDERLIIIRAEDRMLVVSGEDRMIRVLH